MIPSYLIFELCSVKNIIVLIVGKRALKCKKIYRLLIQPVYCVFKM